MSTFYANFVSGAGGGGGGGGGGANTSLSNLTNPTAINQDLIFAKSNPAIETEDESGIPSQSLTIKTGSSDQASGALFLSTGDMTGFQTSGNTTLSTGPGTLVAGGASGSLTLSTGDADTGPGSIIIAAGNQTNPGNGGAGAGVTLITGGSQGSGGSGTLFMATAAVAGTGPSGGIFMATGQTNGANADSGSITLDTGLINVSGNRGKIQLKGGSEGTAGQVWTSTDTNGSGEWMPVAAGTSLSNDVYLTGRNAANDDDIPLVKIDATNSPIFGNLETGGYIRINNPGGGSININPNQGAGNTNITGVQTQLFPSGGQVQPLVFVDSINNAAIYLQAPTTVTANTFFTLPNGDGQNHQYMVTDGAGQLSFTQPAIITPNGTTGDQTIDNVSGTVNIAGSSSSVVVNNSFVTANSIVLCVLRSDDPTALLKCVTVASGMFTVTLTAAATAEVSVGFFVVN